jgi:hypothetical protein
VTVVTPGALILTFTDPAASLPAMTWARWPYLAGFFSMEARMNRRPVGPLANKERARSYAKRVGPFTLERLESRSNCRAAQTNSASFAS